MDSSTPSTTSSSAPTPTLMDSAALRSCQKCHRRMGSLKYDSHTFCSQCRDVVCSMATRRNECQDWSADIMSEYIKHKKSLATKRGKKPATAAASGSSQPAVASSPLLGSPPRLPSVSDDDKLRDAFLSVLQNLSQTGSIGTNPFSFAVPSSVPDYTPHVWVATGGDGCPKAQPDLLVWVLLSIRHLLLRPNLCILIYLLMFQLVLGQINFLIVLMLCGIQLR